MGSRTFLVLFLFVLPAVSRGESNDVLALGGPFSDHMVVQADVEWPVWGTAQAGAKIVVAFQGVERSTVAGSHGTWNLLMPRQAATSSKESHQLRVSTDGASVIVRDVVVGEVWLCSGQSNMRYTLGRREIKDAPASAQIFPRDLEQANDSGIRILNVSSGDGSTPAQRRWGVCSPNTVAGFSAVGYFFGKALRANRGAPVGLIDLGKGGQSIRAFLSPEQIANDERLACLRSKDPEKEGGAVYERDVLWLAPFALRGVLWYQGESDITRALQYPGLLASMVERWRRDFQNPRLPFLVVQLPVYAGKSDDPADQRTVAKWRPYFREAQELFTNTTPDTFLADTVDLGERHDIHPKGKERLAGRLALLALAKVYGQPIASAGPVLKRWSRDGGDIVLEFAQAEAGLVAHGRRLDGFFASSGTEEFQPAEAIIEPPDKVRVRGPIDFVRYGWSGYFDPSLYNHDGLPARPFRTDKLPPQP